MLGTHATTGAPLDGLAHIEQSVADILATPIGSRVMRRTYGSLVPALLDMPANPATLLRVQAAAASALALWEPRLVLQAITAAPAAESPGRVLLTITALLAATPDAPPLTITVAV